MPSGKVPDGMQTRLDPEFGVWKVNPEAKAPLSPFGLVTTTLTAPAELAGVVAVIWVGLTTVTAVAAALPKAIVAPARKPVPLMVTAVPPPVGPLVGEMVAIVGAGSDSGTIV